MNAIFALNGLSYFGVFLILFYIFYSLHKKDYTVSEIGNILGVNGIFYLLMFFLNFLWVFGFLEANNKDFVLLNLVLTVINSTLILYAVYKITSNKNLIYLLVLFITSVLAINLNLNAFFIITSAASYLLLTIVFLDLAFFYNYYLKRAGNLGLLYVAVSLLFSVLAFFWLPAYTLFWFIPNSLMFFVFLFIYLDVDNLGVIKKVKAKRKKQTILSYAGALVKFLTFITSISAFVLVSTVAIHELGHAFAAQYYGCNHPKAVIYDIIGPHTEIRCETKYNNASLTLAGVAATFIMGMLFVLTGTQFTRGISYLLFGFGFLISYGDLMDLKISKNLIAIVLFLSLIIITIAIVKISIYHLRQQDIFKKPKNILEFQSKDIRMQNDAQPKNV